jgi:hypothetical protein
MRQSKLDIVGWFERKGVTRPRQKSLSLSYEPVFPAIELDCDYGGNGRLGREQRSDGTGSRHLLVEKRDTNGGAAEGLEE